MAERSKAPDSRNSSVENSGTRVCAWVRIPLLSENVLNAKRQSFQLTNSVILEHQFKIKAQSKRKQKNGNIIGGRQPSGFQVHKKEDNQPIHVKHESTRGFERKSFHMDDTNRLADYITELEKLPNGRAANRKKKMCRRKQGRMAERSKEPGSRKSSVENSGTRVCAWVRIQLLSENVLNAMRQTLQLTNSVTLERYLKMIVQSKRKQKNRNVVCGW